MESKPKTRLHYLDVAKGGLILSLLITHFGIALKWAGVPDRGYFLPFYYIQPLWISFFMQCFYVITGYCTGFSNEPKVFAVKQLRQLVIPYFFFATLQMMDFLLSGRISLTPTSVLHSYWGQFWFLHAILIARVIIYVLVRYIRNSKVVLIASALMLVVGIMLEDYSLGTNICYIRHGLIASFFVALGYCFKKNNQVFEKLMKVSLIVYPTVILYRFAGHILPVQDAGISVSITEIPLFVLVALSGSLFFLKICSMINSVKVLEFFGRNSLAIYCLHMIPFVHILQLMHCTMSVPSSMGGAILFLLCVYLLEVGSLSMIVYLLNQKYVSFLIGK